MRSDITAADVLLPVEYCVMDMMRRVRLIIRGRVQGVYYRTHTEKAATRLGLCGWVRNCDNGTVEVLVEGSDTRLEAFIAWCHQGSPTARVDRLEVSEETDEVALASGFGIVF